MSAGKVDFDTIPWTTLTPNVRFKVHRQGSRQLRLIEFGAGFQEPDWCTRGHIGLVLEGTGRLQFQGSETIVKKGDGVFLRPGEEDKHRLTVLGKVFRVIVVEDV
jgi:quercetin dioxygenase-like cupin family protein